jgi:hypothetical protein
MACSDSVLHYDEKNAVLQRGYRAYMLPHLRHATNILRT